jgi:hypothetical protein
LFAKPDIHTNSHNFRKYSRAQQLTVCLKVRSAALVFIWQSLGVGICVAVASCVRSAAL